MSLDHALPVGRWALGVGGILGTAVGERGRWNDYLDSAAQRAYNLTRLRFSNTIVLTHYNRIVRHSQFIPTEPASHFHSLVAIAPAPSAAISNAIAPFVPYQRCTISSLPPTLAV